MKSSKIMVILSLVIAFICSLSQSAVGQDKASAQEIIKNVRDAADRLAKSGAAGLADFNKKPSQWVWKDSYIFVLDCGKRVMAAHPMKPELVGQDILALKDTKGNPFFGRLCEASSNPNGLWAEYWWPKPGEKEGSRKISYALSAAGTPYVVGAGIYDDQAALAELEKLSTVR
jgi:signal transduction histidine kinase